MTRWFIARVYLKAVEVDTCHIGYVSFGLRPFIRSAHQIRTIGIVDRQDELAAAVLTEEVKMPLGVGAFLWRG